MKMTSENISQSLAYDKIKLSFKEWLHQESNMIRKSDVNEDFVRATPTLDMAVKSMCHYYKVNHKLKNYNVGLIEGVCSSQFDVFVTTGEWYDQMRNHLEL